MKSYLGGDLPGHVFISYVREDRQRVDRLQAILAQAGINVWRDTGSLWPGQDWQIEIRRAIMSRSLAFIACFSEHSDAKGVSYQNDELIVAVEQMRRRPPRTEVARSRPVR
jgi:TIR domain